MGECDGLPASRLPLSPLDASPTRGITLATEERSAKPARFGGLMTQVPPSDIFTRRVCLRLDGMDGVTVQRDLAYGPPDRGLRFDLYYPPDERNEGRWPAVIIVAGYPGTLEPGPTTLPYKAMGWTVSMCQLIALSGIVAIAYTNREPVADLQGLFEHIQDCAESLTIDPARVGVIAAS